MRLFLFLSLALGSIRCSGGGGGSNSALSGLVASPPVLASASPQIGSPAQNNLNSAYPATIVTIIGSNFGTDTVVRFNSLPAPILANTGTEITTTVPDGTVTGVLSVSKSGGSCTPGQKTGVNCAGLDFFVDCYSVTNKQYGDELEIPSGNSKRITFLGVQTKAFRSSVLKAPGNITIGCDSVVTVRVFSKSCVATDQILVKDPTIPIPADTATQFYVTAGNSTCTIGI